MAAPNIVAGTMPAVRGGMDLITVTLSPVAVAANTTAAQSLTVSGLAVGDIVVKVEKPTHQAGLGIVGSRVSAADTLSVTFVNATGSSITPTASESYLILVHRPYQARTETTFGG
jgi:hypothetical protein